MTNRMPLVERLLALLDHLGLSAAHVAAQMPGDLVDLVLQHPNRVAGLVLAAPSRLDPAAFTGIADRLLMIAGEHGITREATGRALPRLAGAKLSLLQGYDAPGWADVVAARTDDVVALVTAHLDDVGGRGAAAPPRDGIERSGIQAGITYRIDGTGPALVLLPFFLAPSQWDPAVAALAKRFSVIRLGGAHIGGVAALEDRAEAPTYRAMFRTLIDFLAPRAGARILDVGCGSGALDRLLAERLDAASTIDAVDVNAFLLREAQALAEANGLGARIRFSAGSAEALPFPDNSFDCVFSVTVLEECDAAKAIAEMTRVVRPGGRVGIVVRSIDVQQWWNFPVAGAAQARAETPPQSVGHGGVADKSLYARMLQAGLVDLIPFPAMITLARPDGPIWRYREDHVVSQLDAGELGEWQRARDQAATAGTLFQVHPLHCAVGTRPA